MPTPSENHPAVTHHYAITTREKERDRHCWFIESESIEEAIRAYCHATRDIHVMEGDKVRIFRVKMGAIEIQAVER